MRSPVFPSLAALVLILGAGPALAAKLSKTDAYDGRWSIEVITEQGSCDRAYRYGIRIEGGETRYEGGTDFTVSGHVARNGAVKGSIARGEARADVIGTLSGDTGAGTWTTNGPSPCRGNWNAERRS
ncbi:hypothetical protein [Methylobacterium sp. Leaf118]|uniref:hypothetical protein n=1 Tax=Methylobacterium sp. Leaf118 TaxID=2876562 RepID=UPI001E3CDB9F|nr:hypothetical protein [Methylobacterium sp. Leaf118]